MEEFAAIINASYDTYADVMRSEERAVESHIAYQLDRITALVESVGDARANNGWTWS